MIRLINILYSAQLIKNYLTFKYGLALKVEALAKAACMILTNFKYLI